MIDKQPQLLLDIEWTDDCQGKKDYDGPVLSISTRYWPRGGGFTLIHNNAGRLDFQENDARPDVPPSATSSLVLRHRPVEGDYYDWSVLATQDFEADTQEDVQRQVEAWAQSQMDRVVSILREHFAFARPD